MEKKRIILPEKKYAKAPAEDLDIKVSLSETKTLLVNDDRNIVLDANILFDDERNESLKYKIYGKLKMIFRNMYYGNITGYTYLDEISYIKTDIPTEKYLPYNEFAFIRNDICRETTSSSVISRDIPFTGFTRTITNTGTTRHQTITEENAAKHNWGLYLSYASNEDPYYEMTYTLSGGTSLSFLSGDGIPFRVSDNINKYDLTSPVEHGMSEGEYIVIDNVLFYINSIGDETYNSENYVITIFKSQIPSGFTGFDETIITGKRCLDKNNISGTTSQYYIHKNKILTEVDDYLLEKIGFESPIFKNEKKVISDTIIEKNRPESVLFDYIQPFELKGILNNLGYTPTDVYLTIIYKNGDGFFEYPPKVGYRFNFHDEWIDEHWDGDSSIETGITTSDFTIGDETFTKGDDLEIGDEINGDFIEYIPTQLKERSICHAYHKIASRTDIFNHHQNDSDYYSGATPTNMFGLFYQPHYRIKLRELSPAVEISNSSNIDNLPQNAVFDENEEIWKWRDLYEHGYIDDLGYGTDFPFINGIHYVKTDINFYLMNEVLFTNKIDGIRDFNAYMNRNTLKNRRNEKNNNKDNLCI